MKKMRGMTRTSIVFAMALAMAAAPAAGAFGWTIQDQSPEIRYIQADTLNVRTSPEIKEGNVSEKMYRGEEVMVTGSGDGWVRIKRNGEDRYVSAEFLSSVPVVAGAAGNTTEGAGNASGGPASAASGNAETSGSQSAGSAGASSAVQESSSSGVTVTEVGMDSGFRFYDFSKIKTGTAKLYKNHDGAHGDVVVCVNAGHGTRGGERVKTLSHPDGTGKVTGGSNPNGAVESISISSGMEFHDGTEERAVTLKEAIKVRDLLLKRGYSVLMIRETEDVQLDNIARTVLANNYALCHIAIHWDSSNNNKGAFFMSVPDGLKYMSPVAETWQKSEALGAALIQGLKGQGVKIFGDGTMDMDLTQTSYSTIASVDIELGDKASDRSDDTLNRLAQGIADGVDIWNAAR